MLIFHDLFNFMTYSWLRMIQPYFVFMMWSLNVSRRSISNIYCKNNSTRSFVVSIRLSKCPIRTQTELWIRVIPFPAEIEASYSLMSYAAYDMQCQNVICKVFLSNLPQCSRDHINLEVFSVIAGKHQSLMIRLFGWKHIVSFIIHHDSWSMSHHAEKTPWALPTRSTL